MICDRCGKEIKDGEKFCRFCGNYVSLTTDEDLNESVSEQDQSDIDKDNTQQTDLQQYIYDQEDNKISETDVSKDNEFQKKGINKKVVAAIIAVFIIIVLIVSSSIKEIEIDKSTGEISIIVDD